MRSVCWVLAAAAAAGVFCGPAHCETANALFVADGRCFAGSASGAVSMVVERIESDGAAAQLLVAEAESGLAAAPVDHYRFRSCDPPYFAWRPDALAPGSLRVTAIDVESGAVIGRALRVPSARGDIWALHVGPVLGEPGHYESYPTAMVEENGAHRMWLAGSWAGDAIFAATGADPARWSYVEGTEMRGPEGVPRHPVLAPTRPPMGIAEPPFGYAHGWYSDLDPSGGEDGLHAADPSVVRVPPRTPGERPFYLMYYTGWEGEGDRDANTILCARSTDAGITWEKLGVALRPLRPDPSQYGAGQSSVVLRDEDGDGSLDLVHFFTDTTVGQPCIAIADPYGDPLSFHRVGETGALSNLGNYTWDMKWAAGLSAYIGVVAINGPPGAVMVAFSADGVDWAGDQAYIPLDLLIDDPGALSCNNGGILGTPLSWLPDDPLAESPDEAHAIYYYGGGESMQWDGGDRSWDIHAMELWLRPSR